jgi:hypothetical protein
MNIEEVAVKFKVHPGTVRAWIRRGLKVKTPGGRGIGYVLDLAEVKEWHRVNILKDFTLDEFIFDFSVLEDTTTKTVRK